MKRQWPVGIIGSGTHGSRYARHILQDVPGLSLAAVCRRSSVGQDQAAEWGARYYADWRALVDDGAVRAVIAAVPPHLNPEIAEACALGGKALLVEKPLASTEKEAARMVETCRREGVALTVGQTLRFNSTVRALRSQLSRAGKLYSFSANHRLEPALHDWLDDPEIAGGGVIHHTAVHLFDALRFITGLEISRVRADLFHCLDGRLEDLLTAQVEMEGDLKGVVDASKIGKARSARFEFVGSEGHLYGDHVHGCLEFAGPGGMVSLSQDDPVHTIALLLADWAKFLDGEGPNPIPGDEGLAAVRICDGCRRSAESGDWIDLA